MNLRETRKRRSSSISSASAGVRSSPRISQATKRAAAAASDANASTTTPRRPKKRVRFSDPGLSTSTGLTPALMRTSFDGGDTNVETGTPSRRVNRRRSTPLPRSSRHHHGAASADNENAERVVQFTPLRQMLDPRTRRRIGRTGLSNEIRHIEREKRDAATYEKALQSLLMEKDALTKELETAKNGGDSGEATTNQDASLSMEPEDRIQQLEVETSRLREDVSFSSTVPDDAHQSNSNNGEGATIMLDDSRMEGDTMLLSDSSDIRGDECQTAVSDGFSLLNNMASGLDVSTQAELPDCNQEAELRSLALDLENARKEKRNLFNACRAQLSSLDGTAVGYTLRQSSPPPDFFEHIVPTLAATIARASDATTSLESVRQELPTLGFPGSNPSDIISEMRSRFRTARIELERAIPGETPDAGLDNANSILGALVKRVELLVKYIGDERSRHDGSLGREWALKGQFDALLVRYEDASKKIKDLEQDSSVSASDMLHTRMRMQEMENEGKEQAVGIGRLNTALEKYREEVKSLETLVTSLEEDKASTKERYSQQVSKLEGKVADEEKARRAAESTISERDARIQELEQAIESNRIRSCGLTAAAESLARERQLALEGLQERTAEQRQQYEQEIGTMNVRISELNTALQEMKSGVEKLQRSNTTLEEELKLEVEARDNLLNKWAADQARSFALMKETVTTERRKAKVRAANFQMRSSDIQSDSSNMPSEPITPVSLPRQVDVEYGRGKNRRRLDSGIGILTEDELLSEMDNGEEPSSELNSDGIDALPSDPANL